ncbi:hypothetical protein, partial [Bosea sp. Root381]|uniref:hypothetical protein n=1 Tax=Bosea sp. Root381 TaxID=1736524 RepID=UPI001AED0341
MILQARSMRSGPPGFFGCLAAITWNSALRARAGEPVLRNLAATGGRSPTGREQRVIGDAGFWHVPLTGLVVNTR